MEDYESRSKALPEESPALSSWGAEGMAGYVLLIAGFVLVVVKSKRVTSLWPYCWTLMSCPSYTTFGLRPLIV